MQSGGLKSSEEENYLRSVLVDHPQFQRLDASTLSALLELFILRFVEEGETLVKHVRCPTFRPKPSMCPM